MLFPGLRWHKQATVNVFACMLFCTWSGRPLTLGLEEATAGVRGAAPGSRPSAGPTGGRLLQTQLRLGQRGEGEGETSQGPGLAESTREPLVRHTPCLPPGQGPATAGEGRVLTPPAAPCRFGAMFLCTQPFPAKRSKCLCQKLESACKQWQQGKGASFPKQAQILKM